MHAIILAGGFATRLWPLTEKIAKPLIEVAGKPLISYIVESLPKDIHITVSTNRVFAEDFEKWKQEYFSERSDTISIFIEDSKGETEKKGALAATALCIQEKKLYEKKEDILLLAGDNYFGFNFADFLSRAKNNPLLAAFDIEDKNEAKKFGVVVPKNKTEVLEFEEKPENPSSTLVSTGAYFFPNHTLEHIVTYSKDHADDLGGIFEFCMKKNISVEYFSFDEEWYDIGSFPSFMSANKYFLEKGLNKNYTTKKIIASCAELDSFTKEFIHSAEEANNFCIIGKGVVLKNVKMSNSIIMDNCYLENVDIANSLVCKNSIVRERDFNAKIVRENTVSV